MLPSWLRNLRWEDYPGLYRWAWCDNKRPSKKEAGESASQERSRGGSDALWRCREGPRAKECRQPLKVGKSKQILPLKPPEDHSFADTSILAHKPAVPKLFDPRDQFRRRQFFHGQGLGMVSGWFEIMFIVHFISTIITSTPPQISRHWILEAGDPCLKESHLDIWPIEQ